MILYPKQLCDLTYFVYKQVTTMAPAVHVTTEDVRFSLLETPRGSLTFSHSSYIKHETFGSSRPFDFILLSVFL